MSAAGVRAARSQRLISHPGPRANGVDRLGVVGDVHVLRGEVLRAFGVAAGVANPGQLDEIGFNIDFAVTPAWRRQCWRLAM